MIIETDHLLSNHSESKVLRRLTLYKEQETPPDVGTFTQDEEVFPPVTETPVQVHYITVSSDHSKSESRMKTYVSAATTSALNQDVGSSGLNSSSNVVEDEFADGNTVCWATAGSVVGLVDDNTVVGDAGEGDFLVGNAGDGSGVAGDGLDADT
jgi:hypothetical protein